MHGLPGLFEAIIEGLGDLPVEVVAAVGRDHDPGRFAVVPTNVRIVDYLPQILVLSRAAL